MSSYAGSRVARHRRAWTMREIPPCFAVSSLQPATDHASRQSSAQRSWPPRLHGAARLKIDAPEQAAALDAGQWLDRTADRHARALRPPPAAAGRTCRRRRRGRCTFEVRAIVTSSSRRYLRRRSEGEGNQCPTSWLVMHMDPPRLEFSTRPSVSIATTIPRSKSHVGM